ncbi:inactive beta-amylase 9-like [Aristolochia californica]|uniref:inactive beta-amylase 9-like n=1 Tax=Aristolochia californica TaxID=171875 RepID=UPI0035D66D8B
MDVLAVGCSQTNVAISEFRLLPKLGFCKSKQVCYDLRKGSRRRPLRIALKTIRSELQTFESSERKETREKSVDRVRLFVGLPIDSVSNCNNLNHTKAIAAGLKALKLLGVQGVELPVWWGIAEKETQGRYDWSAYLALVEMIRSSGLKLRASICFHASADTTIPLPQWVSQIGEAQPDIFFTDRSGRRYKGCLSLSVDDLPVFDGRTPMQVYEGFFRSFQSSFSAFFGSTITDISVSLGPDGELRYPSFLSSSESHQFSGVGEFQCYDKHMLSQLKQQADSSGNQFWVLSGPHDAPTYNQSPESNGFCRENGGSWESPYGDFFLSWYSNQLLSHGDRLLSLASSTFSSSPVTVSGTVPLLHSWYNTCAHPAELTGGYYNTANRNGYEAIAEIFAKNSCKMVLPGMELSDHNVAQASHSSPDSLASQIMRACEMHGVEIFGENSSSVSRVSGSFENIKNKLISSCSVDSFTYQRMGAYFFSPEHFPLFSEFVRSFNQWEFHLDDLPGLDTISSRASSEKDKGFTDCMSKISPNVM